MCSLTVHSCPRLLSPKAYRTPEPHRYGHRADGRRALRFRGPIFAQQAGFAYVTLPAPCGARAERLRPPPLRSRLIPISQSDSDSENSAVRMLKTCLRSPGISSMDASQRICQSRSKYACTILCRTAVICRHGTSGYLSLNSTDRRLIASLLSKPRPPGKQLLRSSRQSPQFCDMPRECLSGKTIHAA